MRGSERDTSVGRDFRVVVALLWVAGVVMITLTSSREPEWGSDLYLSMCVFCGSRGASDAILNVVLFLPVGLLAAHRRGIGFAVVAGLLVSGFIETTQFSLPGRHPSLGDLMWNTTGAAVGAVLAVALRRWLSGKPPAAARALALFLPALYLFGAGWLAEPAGTDARYFGQWTADLRSMEKYQGTLLSAEIDEEPVPRGPYPSPDAQPDLRGDFRVDLVVVKGPPPSAIAPILSLYDGRQEELLVLGADGEDLVWRLRDRALAAGFDVREVRVRDALAPVAVGDTVVLSASRTGGTLCLGVDGPGAGPKEWCGLGFAPEGTWRYLMNLEGASLPFRTALNLGWMVSLFVLVGLAPS